jgi:hypothetical protein
MATLKILFLATIFIATSGAFYSEYFRKHRLISFIAALISLAAMFYLIEDIYEDIYEINKKESALQNSHLKSEIDLLNARMAVTKIRHIRGADDLSESNGTDEWKKHITPVNAKRIEDIEVNIYLANNQNFNKYFKASDREGLARLDSIFQEKDYQAVDQEIIGVWKCRVSKLSKSGVMTYPFYICKIKKTKNGLFFEKVSGSQRRSGYLFRKNSSEYVFLGGWSVNGQPQQLHNGISDPESTAYISVGVFVVKKDRFFAFFSRNNKSYEMYELIK